MNEDRCEESAHRASRCVLVFLKAAERGDVQQSDICASFISLPASPGLLPTLQLDRSIHAAPPAPSPQPFVKTRGLCVPA